MTTVETNPKVPIILVRNALSFNNNLTVIEQMHKPCQSLAQASSNPTLYSFQSINRNPSTPLSSKKCYKIAMDTATKQSCSGHLLLIAANKRFLHIVLQHGSFDPSECNFYKLGK
jgi:hypothetical protein